jgi:Holliday junction resolvase
MVRYRSRKARGATAERDLIHKFWERGWAAMRSAGSGSTSFPSPDVIAGKGGRTIVIEAKITLDNNKYLTIEEVEHLEEFAEIFSAEAWVAIKFPRTKWMFFKPEDLDRTEKSFKASKRRGEYASLSFDELVEKDRY